MSSESETRKSMDDVLASIRRIIRGDKGAAEQAAPSAPQAEADAEAADDMADAVLTLTAARPAPSVETPAGTGSPSTADDDEDDGEALVLGPTMQGDDATANAEAGADQEATLHEDEFGLIRAAAPAGAARAGLSLVSSTDRTRGDDAGEEPGSILRGGLEADLQEGERGMPPEDDGPPIRLEPGVDTEAGEPEPAAGHWRAGGSGAWMPGGEDTGEAAEDAREPDAGDAAAIPGEEMSADEPPAEESSAEESASEETDADEAAAEEASTEEASAEEASAEGAPEQDDAAPDEAMTGEVATYGAEADEAAPAASDSPPEAAFDMAEVEETVRRVLRDELEGEMGQRLSKNIQRMIREEVARAMLRR